MRQFDQTLQDLGLFVQTTKQQQERLYQTEKELSLLREQLQAEILRNQTLNEDLKKISTSSIKEISELKDQNQKLQFDLVRLKKAASAQLKRQDLVYQARFQEELSKKQKQFQSAFQEATHKVQRQSQIQQKGLTQWRTEVIKKLESSHAEVQSSRIGLNQASSQAELAQSEVERLKKYLTELNHHYQNQFSSQEQSFQSQLREHEQQNDQSKSLLQKKLDQSLSRCNELQSQYDEMVKAYQNEISTLETEIDRVRRKMPLTELLTIKDQQISRLKAHSESATSNPEINKWIEDLEHIRNQIRLELNH